MKQRFWMAALASVALVSCVNEMPVMDNKLQPLQELKFGDPMLYNQSRALGEILGAKYPTDESFVVYSVIHNGTFNGWEKSLNYLTPEGEEQTANGLDDKTPFFPKEGVVVSKSTTNNYWHINGNTKYLWPTNKVDSETKEPTTDYKMTFAAYSPASMMNPSVGNPHAVAVSYSSSGLAITGYQMPDDPADHFDLMYSTRTTDAESSPVAINFKHALASIRFMFVKQAESTGGAYLVNVKKVEIVGDIYNKGNFDQKITAIDNSSGNPTWTLTEIVKEDDGSGNKVTKNYVLYDDAFTVPEGVSQEIIGISSFMPIPQSVNANMAVRITYEIQNNASDDMSTPDPIVIPFTDFKLPSSTNTITAWNRGHRYVYTIQFGALKEIFFAPTVSEDWVTTNNAAFFSIGNVGNSGGVTP